MEDTVSSRLHGNPISLAGKEAKHVYVQKQCVNYFTLLITVIMSGDQLLIFGLLLTC